MLGTTAERGPRAGARRGRARRGRDRDPVGAGHAARPGGRRLPRPWDPGPHDADRVRAAAGRLRPARGHPPAARGPGRGHSRPRAGTDGARAGRRVPGGGGRARDRRRRFDRLRAVPADRPRRHRAGWCWSTTPRTTCSRSSASSRRTATSAPRCRCWPTARSTSGCARCSAEHRPAVVFHAAAYKHVTMMELNPVEAIRNNALATQLMARIAGEIGVGTFVLVSTDKAVKPATVMGASKALAEWAVEAAAARYPQTTVRDRAVRQRARLVGLGRADLPPPDRRRRPGDRHRPAHEAVLHDDPGGGPADHPGRLAQREWHRDCGELFVLEMGDPVRIVELAETMIRLSGLEPERDIAIEIVGARPGEKLHEDLFNPYERPQPTPAQKIVRAQRDPLDPEWVEQTFTRSTCWCWRATRPRSRKRVAKLARRRLSAGRSGRPARHVDCRSDGVDAARALGPQLHIVGRRRRRVRLDHRPGDPGAPVLRAREGHREPARRGRGARPPAASGRDPDRAAEPAAAGGARARPGSPGDPRAIRLVDHGRASRRVARSSGRSDRRRRARAGGRDARRPRCSPALPAEAFPPAQPSAPLQPPHPCRRPGSRTRRRSSLPSSRCSRRTRRTRSPPTPPRSASSRPRRAAGRWRLRLRSRERSVGPVAPATAAGAANGGGREGASPLRSPPPARTPRRVRPSRSAPARRRAGAVRRSRRALRRHAAAAPAAGSGC